jgi:hypothetical protein
MRGHVRYALDQTAETLHKAHDAGVKFVAGNDSGFAIAPYGEFHARELELHMIYCGLSTAEAIRSGTSDAAVVMGMPDEVGVMRTGAYADLLLVDGNPLENIRLLQDKDKFQVFKDGQPVGEDPHGHRWHHDRAQIMSTGELTYDLVTSELPATGSDHIVAEPPSLSTLLDPKEHRDLLHDLSLAQVGASWPEESRARGSPSDNDQYIGDSRQWHCDANSICHPTENVSFTDDGHAVKVAYSDLRGGTGSARRASSAPPTCS